MEGHPRGSDLCCSGSLRLPASESIPELSLRRREAAEFEQSPFTVVAPQERQAVAPLGEAQFSDAEALEQGPPLGGG